jgi:hypothetical protein
VVTIQGLYFPTSFPHPPLAKDAKIKKVTERSQISFCFQRAVFLDHFEPRAPPIMTPGLKL